MFAVRSRLASLLVLACVLALLPAPPLVAQDTESLVESMRDWRRSNEKAILGELVELLKLPNVAADRENIERNADLLVAMLERRGISARKLEAPGSTPAVYGELTVPGASRTLVFYSHYDGQPVDPARWASDPWVPVLRDGVVEEGAGEVDLATAESPLPGEWRLYGRSASDDKAPIVAMLAALDGLRATGRKPSVNLKFFFEGEEEAGSPHLADMLSRHADLLQADGWLFCDGPVHQSRRAQVVYGVRGAMGLELTVYGPLRSLHSGHYGNWAPNPAAILADLVASMRDPDGRILIEGFYDDVPPLSAADRAALAQVPDADEALRHALALAESEAGNARLVERILLPALNVRGLASAQVGEGAKNAIPTEAHASLGFRLVPDQTPEGVRRRVEEFLRGEGWHLVTEEPSEETRRAHRRVARLTWGKGYRAMRTPIDLPFAQAVQQVVSRASGGEAIPVPILGGSLPLYLFEEVLGAKLLVVPIANHDNNQHAPNENIRLQNLWDGIELYAALMAEMGEEWSE